MKFQHKRGYAIPAAIVLAGLFIAGSIFLASGGLEGGGSRTSHSGGNTFRAPDETDHVRGNPDAAIAVVEFSDFECPFCARLHPTLARLTEENDDVKWVYRHFPLSSIHSRALGAAVASECIAKLGTNDAFWNFTDAAFSNQRGLNEKWYIDQARSLGIGEEAFRGCLNDRSITSLIEEDLDEAVQEGGRGTPFVIVVTPAGERIPFSGALPYEQVASIIERARNN